MKFKLKLNNLENKYNFIQYFLVGIVAFFLNFWVSNLGVFPIDTFLHYDSAYKILNGEKPVKDFWIIHGITLDYIQSIFFYFFGVNWVSYISHSSFINAIVSIMFLKLTKELNLNIYYSIILTLCFLTLAYPISGVPFIDHHSTFLCLISFIIFYSGLKKKNYKFFILIPIFLGLAFFSKPVPSAYLILSLGFVLMFNFFREKDVKPILNLFYGFLIFLIFIFIFLKYEEIPIGDFLDQLILYPMSIGNDRSDLFIVSLQNRFFNFKFIFVTIIYLIFLLIFKKNYKQFADNDLAFLALLLLFSFVMIYHQLLTNNQNFIFFLIPINVSLIIFLNEKFKIKSKNIINIFFVVSTIFLTIKYHERFNLERKFHDLQGIDLNNFSPASTIHETLYPLKWITSNTNKDPEGEISLIKSFVVEIENSKNNILLISNHNYIDSITSKKIFSIVKNYDPVTIPKKNNKYRIKFNNFFKQKLKEKNIQEIILFFPQNSNINLLEKSIKDFLGKTCLSAVDINFATLKLKIDDC